MQRERIGEALLPSLREYTARWGLTRRRLDLLDDKAILMHPGPMNRGVEIAADVADHPRATIIDQVRNGVAVRMAVLYDLLGSGADLPARPQAVAAAPGNGERQ
jgi:aspartate carbamoyltransferase catalytic subunit